MDAHYGGNGFGHRSVVASLDLDEGPLAFVRLELTGGERVTAAVTGLALDDMGLRVGSPVFALVKSVALDERGDVKGGGSGAN